MTGKYTNPLKYHAVRAQRSILRTAIAPLVSWSPLSDPSEGYTVIVGCHGLLGSLLLANLAMISRQDCRGIDRIILVIDRPRAQMPKDIEPVVRSRFGSLPIEFIYYRAWQRRIATMIGWAWVFSWMSWAMGIASTRTRFAMLHDFDAFLLEPHILLDRYKLICQRQDTYVGTRFYGGNGLLESDHLAATYELIFDVQYVREHFQPIDLFNHVSKHEGRTIDYDTFLWAQHQHGSASVLPIDEEHMVHPSQMICQFTELLLHDRQPSRQPNLPLLPYFFDLGGEPNLIREHTRILSSQGVNEVPFFGRSLLLDRLSMEHASWLRKQAARLENTVHGEIRPHVSEYFDALERVAQQNA